MLLCTGGKSLVINGIFKNRVCCLLTIVFYEAICMWAQVWDGKMTGKYGLCLLKTLFYLLTCYQSNCMLQYHRQRGYTAQHVP